MAINKRLLVKPPSTGITPSEHFGVVLYEGDGSSSHSINGGKFGAGAYFGGSADATLPFNLQNTPFTVSFWAKNTLSSTNYYLIANDSGSTQTGWYIGGNGNSGTSYAFRFNSGSTNHFNFTSSTVDDSDWHHVVMTFDNTTNTNGAKIYINGSLDTQATSGSTGNVSFTNSTTLLMKEPGGSLRSTGLLDQLRIFQKALSSSEVSTLYAETTPESLDPLSEDTTDTLQVLGDSSCVATYRFENDETDLSGNYDGTGTAIQYAAGRYGQAASFNGSSSYIDLGSTVDNPLRTAGEFGVSFWFNASSYGSNSVIFKLLNDIYVYIFLNTSNQLECRVVNSSDVSSTITTSVSLNTWYHVVWTGNSANGVTLYLNGSSVNNTSWNGTFLTYTNTNYKFNYLGYNGSNVGWYSGKIDQVRIFNKALSASEVTTLYNENSLVASYRFEGNANDDTRNYDGTATNVTYEYGLNFTPDFVWVKNRDSSIYSHYVTDSTRGAGYVIIPNDTIAETYGSNRITSFDSGGFTLGDSLGFNKNGDDYVAWCFKANGGTTSSNTDGTITSTVQVNQDAGFSIVQYTGNGNTATQTIGHGLSSAPELIIQKSIDLLSTYGTNNWLVGGTILGAGGYMFLNNTNAKGVSADAWSNTIPTDSVFSVSGGPVSTRGGNELNKRFINYCFYSVEGFSKIGTYTGNGSTSNIIETGFEPAFLMTKRTDTAGYNWYIWDNKRNTTNPRYLNLQADRSNAEFDYSAYPHDFLSNGFEVKTSNTAFNASGGTYIYMAFAADPDTEAPTVAKSFSTVAYTGNDGTQDIDVGFKPGLVWLKNRNNSSDSTHEHSLFDNLRGAFRVRSNSGGAENDYASHYGGINDNGFQVKNGLALNDADGTYVAWAWKADDNEPTINTEGSIDSLVSANANAGFSIVKYTGNGTNNATVGHGLSAAPEMIIIKNLDGTYAWVVYNSTLGATKYLHLDATDAQQTTSLFFNDTNPSSTVFTLGTHAAVNESGYEMIAYCFHSVSGYSKIGSYTGNGGSNSITGLGFQPDFLLIKDSTSTGNWLMYDSLRTVSVGDNAGTANARPYILVNGSGKENGVTSYNVNLDSGGFSMNTSSSELNSSGETYIYMAFKIN